MGAYFIKDGYVHNTSLEHDGDQDNAGFWSPERQLAARYYQWHPYAHARSLLRKHKHLKRVVDLGCGTCAKIDDLIAPYCESITAVDSFADESILASKAEKLSYVKMNLEDPKPLGASFDLAICVDLVEHLIEPNALFEYFHTILDKDSLLLLSTPERDRLRGESCLSSPKKDHVREWNQAEFRSYVESRGFRVHKHFLAPFMKFTLKQPFFNTWKAIVSRTGTWNTCQVVVCSRK